VVFLEAFFLHFSADRQLIVRETDRQTKREMDKWGAFQGETAY